MSPPMMPSLHKKKTSRPIHPRSSSSSSSSSSSNQKTEILINVYDLLPPGHLASTLWFLGSSLLHTGLVIRSLGREYAYGGHDRPDLTGVYWTPPQTAPPGGTWRCELLHGITTLPTQKIEEIVKEASARFQGTGYNLLSRNCNHFTSHLCERLTGRKAPRWLNRAASIGIALPCMVPREWVNPPDHVTAEGDLVEEEEDDDDDDDAAGAGERTGMLRGRERSNEGRSKDYAPPWQMTRVRSSDGQGEARGKSKDVMRDAEGRVLPVPERAPDPGLS